MWPLPDLSRRYRQHEWMDDASVSEAELRVSLAFIERINRWLGYTRATLSHLKRFSRTWRKGETIHIIDLATGSADVPRAILRWATHAGFDVRVVGVDFHPTTTAIANERHNERLTIVRGDALDPPFADGSFDYALTSMFLHHLSAEDAVRVLRALDRLATRGIIAADLLRHPSAYAWISLFTVASNPVVRHDARASVRQAFDPREVMELCDRAGIGYAKCVRHFGHRFVLSGENAR
jgi:SAM-dependent methyltransferase